MDTSKREIPMNRMRTSLWTLALLLMLLPTASSLATVTAEVAQRGDLLAEFLITGRGVVAKSLGEYKINDATIGPKGLTPDMFINKINQGFKTKTGIDIAAGSSTDPVPAETLQLLGVLLEASGQVYAENQVVIDMKGLGFKGFIPATYGKMVSDIFRDKTGIVLKQTSAKNRNTYNAPDAFESKILARMSAPDYPKSQAVTELDGDHYRVMKPIYIKQACLKCHGDPAGEKDVAGRIKEGYKDGDLRGAISVTIAAK